MSARRSSSILRLRTATRASSPMRPGRTAFANRPTPNAEKTARNGGSAAGIACSITLFQAPARAITDRRLSAIAATTHCQATNLNASATRPQSGPCQTKNAIMRRERDEHERRASPLRLQQLRHPYAANAFGDSTIPS